MTVAEMQAEAAADYRRNQAPETQAKVQAAQDQARLNVANALNLRRNGASQDGAR